MTFEVKLQQIKTIGRVFLCLGLQIFSQRWEVKRNKVQKKEICRPYLKMQDLLLPHVSSVSYQETFTHSYSLKYSLSVLCSTGALLQSFTTSLKQSSFHHICSAVRFILFWPPSLNCLLELFHEKTQEYWRHFLFKKMFIMIDL